MTVTLMVLPDAGVMLSTLMEAAVLVTPLIVTGKALPEFIAPAWVGTMLRCV